MTADRYPSKQAYEVLYAKYLQTPADTLLKIAELKNGERVLDLCAGTLALCNTALDMGAGGVWGVDVELDMFGEEWARPNLTVICGTVEYYLEYYFEVFHLITCRQAVNNWLTAKTAAMLPQRLYPAGRFIFNTFNQSPPNKPMPREYWLPIKSPYDVVNRKYVEVTWRIENLIHHIQIAEGYEPHYTTFRWIDRNEYLSILSPHFDVEVVTKDRTDYYICKVRK